MQARGGRGAWIGAALLLLGVLIAARFPYQRLLPPLLSAARAATGAQIEVGELGLSLGWSGPGLVARDLRLSWPGAESLELAAVRVRPAWSLAWLSGTPLWHVDATGDAGTFQGLVAAGRVDGRWDAVDMDALPWALLQSTPPLHGRLSGAANLVREQGVWLGSAELRGDGGSVDLPGLPVAIPFEALEAKLEVLPEQITLSKGHIRGPLVTASVAGTASASGDAFSSWPLALEVEIEALDPKLSEYLPPLGIPVSDGRAEVRVTGSLGAPYIGTPVR